MSDRRACAVLQTFSRDSVGITADITAFLSAHDANIRAVHTTRLEDSYGQYISFDASEESMARLRELCGEALGELSPRIHVVREANPPNEECIYNLSIYAFDQMHLVSASTELLRDAGVGIVAMSGCTYSAPEIGTPLFVVEMKLQVPERMSLSKLCAELDGLAHLHDWDLDLKPSAPTQGRGRDSDALASPFPPSRAATVRRSVARDAHGSQAPL